MSLLPAQTPQTILGDLVSARDERYDRFVYHDGSSLYSVGSDASTSRTFEFYITKYDEDFNKIQSWSFDGFEYQKNNTLLWKYFANEGGVHLLFTCYDKREDQKYLIHRLVDYDGNLGPVQVVSGMTADKKSSREFIVEFSNDSSKTMIYNDVDKKERSQYPLVTIYDEDFSKLWSRRISNPFTDGQVFKPISTKVGNDGTLFILGYRGKRRDQKNGNETDLYGVLSFNDDQVQSYDLSSLGKVIHTMGMQPDVNGNLVVVGLYADSEKEDISGSIYVALDPETMQPVTNKMEPFSEEFLENFTFSWFEAAVSKSIFTGAWTNAKSGFQSFNYDQFIVNADGSMIVLASRYYDEVRSYDGIMNRFYHSDEIMPMKFNADGSMAWLNLVPRKQMIEQFDQHCFYFIHKHEGNLHIIFNDTYSNEERYKTGAEWKMHGSSYSPKYGTVDMVLDLSTGKYDYHLLTTMKDSEKTAVAPKELMSINESMVVGVYKSALGGKLCFMKMKF